MKRSTPDYEQQVKSAKLMRKIGYTLLWFFLGGFIVFLSWQTDRNYPMSDWVIGILLLIGIAKLIYTVKFYNWQHQS